MLAQQFQVAAYLSLLKKYDGADSMEKIILLALEDYFIKSMSCLMSWSINSLSTPAAVAQSIKRPELMTLKEVRMNWHEFDSRLVEKNPNWSIFEANNEVSARFRK